MLIATFVTRSARFICAGALLLSASCAARVPPATRTTGRAGYDPFLEHALRAKSAATVATAADAAHARAPIFFKDIQLSTGNLSSTDIRDGNGARVALRLGFDRPWLTSSLKDGLGAERDANTLLAGAAQQQGISDTCYESANAHTLEAERALYATYRVQLEQVGTWSQGWLTAGTLDPLSASRSALFIARHLWSDMPSPAQFRVHENLGLLPAITVETSPLARDPIWLRERVSERPDVQSHVALSRQRDSLASAERGQRLPWLDFVQLGYPAHPANARDFQGRIAVSVPVGDGSRGRAERQSYLGHSERIRADSELERLLRVAALSLDVLDRFEEQAAQLQRLTEMAQQSEDVGLKFLNARAERPDQVAQLLSEAYAVRRAVLAARNDAAKAACDLFRATGVEYAKWPREKRKDGTRDTP